MTKLPVVVNDLSVELIRDGGSLSANYVSTDDKVYRLIFWINQRHLPGEVERIGYSTPILGRVIQIYRDGLFVGNDLADVVEPTWSEAVELLESMASQINEQKPYERERYDNMVYIAEHGGSLPPNFPTKVKSRRLGS